ncbi:MAG: MBL fold metallo-hydrolase [Leptospiraceae bacterium]|nr:MBL fold metallo-hydrolase [Leptospiraceae bacterium]MDW8305462.1 MBL fold metallo-hydrolase [Leptospiraceae bacterium]
MKVRFWGVRGSIASAITGKDVENKLRAALALATPADLLTPESVDNFIASLPFSIRGTYGGNTTCVELLSEGDEQICVIDAGTGIRPLGNSLLERGRLQGNDEIYLFFTHSHWDHIQGLMFFAPIYIPGNTFHIYSSFADIEERLRYQQVRTHFPVIMDEMAAKRYFYHIPELTPTQVGKFTVKTKAVRHPGGCYSLRFEENGKTFVFCSDAEFNLDTMDEIGSYVEFFYGADVLVFDTQYTFEESLRKIDWGHSSAAIATDIALRSAVKKLVMFHHDPSYSDSKMDDLIIQTLKYKDMAGQDQDLEIVAAYEGLTIEI